MLHVAGTQDSPHNGMFARKHCIILLDKMFNNEKLQYSTWREKKKKGTLSQVPGYEYKHIPITC